MFHTYSANAVTVINQDVSHKCGELVLLIAKNWRNVLIVTQDWHHVVFKAWHNLAPSLMPCLYCTVTIFCHFLGPSLMLFLNPRIRGSPSQSDFNFASSQHLFFEEIRLFLCVHALKALMILLCPPHFLSTLGIVKSWMPQRVIIPL